MLCFWPSIDGGCLPEEKNMLNSVLWLIVQSLIRFPDVWRFGWRIALFYSTQVGPVDEYYPASPLYLRFNSIW